MTKSPTGRYLLEYRPPFHELPRFGGRLRDHTVQLPHHVHELEYLHEREIECWRMFGLHVEQVQDETWVCVVDHTHGTGWKLEKLV